MLIRQLLATGSTKTYRGVNSRRYITIHETANRSIGADAAAHARLQATGNVRDASWHWQVDDAEAIQSFSHLAQCWHAGDGSSGTGNLASIAIEICVNADGDFKATIKNAVTLVRRIMADEGIPLSRVVQHNHWSGKDCPNFLRDGSQGITWAGFLAMISDPTTAEDDVELTDLIGTVNPADKKTPSTVGAALAIGQNYSFYAWEIARALDAKVSNLVGAINALAQGEDFDEAKLLAGVEASAAAGAQAGAAAALAELEAVVRDVAGVNAEELLDALRARLG